MRNKISRLQYVYIIYVCICQRALSLTLFYVERDESRVTKVIRANRRVSLKQTDLQCARGIYYIDPIVEVSYALAERISVSRSRSYISVSRTRVALFFVASRRNRIEADGAQREIVRLRAD